MAIFSLCGRIVEQSGNALVVFSGCELNLKHSSSKQINSEDNEGSKNYFVVIRQIFHQTVDNKIK